jgi:hypothetical protein
VRSAGAASPAAAGSDQLKLLGSAPEAWARQHPRPRLCEEAARGVRTASGPDWGWKAIQACAGKKGAGELLERLADVPWLADLRTRPEAVLLLGKVLSVRGGDLASDLALLKKMKVPLFSLDAGAGHPELYRGRSVAFIARVELVEKAPKGKGVARLAEQSVVTRATGTRLVPRYSTTQKQDEHGRRYRERDGYAPDDVVSTYDNGFEDTGVGVIAYLQRLDPFFEPGGNFLVVGRFDGLVEVPEALDERQPAVTILGYYQTSEQLVVE